MLAGRGLPRLEEGHRPPRPPRGGRPLDRNPPIPRLTSPVLHQGAPPHRRGSALYRAAGQSNRAGPGVRRRSSRPSPAASPRRHRHRARAFVCPPSRAAIRRPGPSGRRTRRRKRFGPFVIVCRAAAHPSAASPAFASPFQATETEPHRSAFPCQDVPRTSSRTGFRSPPGRRGTPPPPRSISPESAGYLLKIVSLDPCT